MTDIEPLVARVVPDVTGLDKQFDYLVPASLRDRIAVGSLVRVMLHGRRIGGWVVALGAEDQVLIYAFGGPSIQVMNAGYKPSNNPDYTSWSANFGVGAEWMVTEQFSIGVELLGRAPIDEYSYTDASENAGINGQATLRAAFHF